MFDYISPYAYLAWKKIGRICERYSLKLNAEPILFGVILSSIGTLGPAEIPSKREYIFKDVSRWANKKNIILNFPPTHPFNPLPALRATCLMENHPQKYQFVDRIFDLCWKEGRDISNPALINHILSEFGVDNGLEKFNSPEIKNLLKEKTDQALNKGIFGVPSMVVDDELFWGNDRLEFLEAYLNGNDGVDQDKIKEIVSRPASITRKKLNNDKFYM
ncbi:2-hydroxychromene-2-carboxylate isomerase [bacterium]|nr:MAG: 2-hydroxychromene-2-carboxylate isomerase [bacterium]